MAVALKELRRKYAHSPDPWNFRDSAYERAKFSATIASLSRPRYAEILEIGCGNGELATRLAAITDCYVGLDAVETALAEARKSVPGGEFHCRFFPCDLPDGDFDLIVASEVLYFLDARTIKTLADHIRSRWPRAEILSVNYLGPSGNEVQGAEATRIFAAALADAYRCETVVETDLYRIDRFRPIGRREP